MYANYFFIATILLSGFSAGAATCVDGEIRALYFGKYRTEKASYCYNSKNSALTSRSCRTSECLALKKISEAKTVARRDLASEFGKPGFKLCRALQGEPELIEFRAGGKWIKSDRCTFQDRSYIATDILMLGLPR